MVGKHSYIKVGMFHFQAQMKDMKEHMEDMKGSINQILLHNPETDSKLEKFEKFSS